MSDVAMDPGDGRHRGAGLLAEDQSSAGRLRAVEARDLAASRALLAAADHRDVDPVMSPIVIDEIRTHQRSLLERPEPT